MVNCSWRGLDTMVGVDFVLAKYKVDGSLDAEFGDQGQVVTDLGSVEDQAMDLTVLPNGSIVVAGTYAGDLRRWGAQAGWHAG